MIDLDKAIRNLKWAVVMLSIAAVNLSLLVILKLVRLWTH